MDGGGSKQYHVLSSAKHDIKSVQGRTDLIWLPTYGRNSFCGKESGKPSFSLQGYSVF